MYIFIVAEKDVARPNAEKMVRLCKVLDISLAYLLDYYEDEQENEEDKKLSSEAIHLAKMYDTLDTWGKEIVRAVVTVAARRGQEDAEVFERDITDIKEDQSQLTLEVVAHGGEQVSNLSGILDEDEIERAIQETPSETQED